MRLARHLATDLVVVQDHAGERAHRHPGQHPGVAPAAAAQPQAGGPDTDGPVEVEVGPDYRQDHRLARVGQRVEEQAGAGPGVTPTRDP
ncbi:hypothetical protein [Nocardioides sp. InS609-2]|uniref:hypothetical protein n=1 Tax=Nocardioides sp. InS609-2 TaxID=2760705 RepID=UPI0020BFE4F4|nr:hypothetical protein [Nocardioides sp. InS609-2]